MSEREREGRTDPEPVEAVRVELEEDGLDGRVAGADDRRRERIALCSSDAAARLLQERDDRLAEGPARCPR
jgi:hypothetical protein